VVAVVGCSSSSQVCHCPEEGCDFSCSTGTASVSVPAGLAAVSRVTATSTCTATYQPYANEVLVSRTGGAGDCDVVAQLADGSSEVAHLHFTVMHYACACYVVAADTVLQPATPASN